MRSEERRREVEDKDKNEGMKNSTERDGGIEGGKEELLYNCDVRKSNRAPEGKQELRHKKEGGDGTYCLTLKIVHAT